MNLYTLLQKRVADGRPLRAGLIGAGKFGSMFLAQARVIPGLQVLAVADLDVDRARKACAATGWSEARVGAGSFAEALETGATHLTDDAPALIAADEQEPAP